MRIAPSLALILCRGAVAALMDAAAYLAAVVASLGTFLPCYLFTVVPAPYFKKYGKRPPLLAFVNAVTAAAIVAITGTVVVLAERSIVDRLTALVAIVTVGLLWTLKKLPEPALVALATIIGLLAFPGVPPMTPRRPFA